MRVDSLDELASAFAEWRRRKKHAREATPEKLVARARRAAKKHGVPAVVRVTRVDRSRLSGSESVGRKTRGLSRKKVSAAQRSAPTFSRLEVNALSAADPRPIAEVETGTGAKLRLFEETPEMLGLLSALCRFGGAR